MPERCSYDYSVIRVVPDVAREEFLNAGVILFAKSHRVLISRITLDESRLLALAPDADVGAIRSHLESIERICEGGEAAGPHGHLSASERFHWLTAPRSTVDPALGGPLGHLRRPGYRGRSPVRSLGRRSLVAAKSHQSTR